jgi:hypothetical protein
MDDTNTQTGLEYLLAIRDGTAPAAPIQAVLDFQLVDVSEGTAAFLYRPRPTRTATRSGRFTAASR